jgi:hypothetical protein
MNVPLSRLPGGWRQFTIGVSANVPAVQTCRPGLARSPARYYRAIVAINILRYARDAPPPGRIL